MKNQDVLKWAIFLAVILGIGLNWKPAVVWDAKSHDLAKRSKQLEADLARTKDASEVFRRIVDASNRLEAEEPGSSPDVIKQEIREGWRQLERALDDYSIGDEKIGSDQIGIIAANRVEVLETELEFVQLSKRIAYAKSEHASPRVIEALEAELYGVKLPHAACGTHVSDACPPNPKP